MHLLFLGVSFVLLLYVGFLSVIDDHQHKAYTLSIKGGALSLHDVLASSVEISGASKIPSEVMSINFGLDSGGEP